MRAVGVVPINSRLNCFAREAEGDKNNPRSLFFWRGRERYPTDTDPEITERINREGELMMIRKRRVLKFFWRPQSVSRRLNFDLGISDQRLAQIAAIFGLLFEDLI